MSVPWEEWRVIEPAAVEVPPGESRTLISLLNIDQTIVLRIMGMGVSQHPGAEYVYEADGITKAVKAPLGTYINPLWTCRDLGQWLEVSSKFTVTVRNGNDKAHKFVSILHYLETRIA